MQNSDLNYKFHSLFKKKQGHLMSSLLVVPDHRIQFATQDADEEILIIARASWVTNISWMLGFIIEVIAIILLVTILSSIGIFQPYMKYLYLLSLIILLLIFDSTYNSFVSWFYNIYILSSKRIIDYDFYNNGSSKISEASLLNIEDVTQAQSGFLPDLFNYGNILVQTAAEKQVFEFHNVPNPTYIRNKIIDLSNMMKQNNKNNN